MLRRSAGHIINMMKLVMGLLLIASLANADTVETINEQVDYLLGLLNQVLTGPEFGLYSLPDHKFPDLDLKNGVLIGLNSLQRIGNATETTHDDGSATVVVHISWHLLRFGYGSIRSQDLEYSGSIKVSNSSFYFAYDVDYTPPCTVNVTHFELERLADVNLIASNPAADRDISDIFAQHVLPYINSNLGPIRDFFWDKLQKNVCFNHHNTNHYSAILNAIENYSLVTYQ